MPVKKKTLPGTSKSSSQAKTGKPEAITPVATPSPGGVVSMRRIVARKLAVEKLIAAKRLG